MNIEELRHLSDMSGDDKMSPDVKRALDRAIMSLLGEPRQEQLFKSIVKYSFFCVYLLFVLITGYVVFGAALGILQVEALWLERAWKIFGIGFGGMVGKELLGAFNSRGEKRKIGPPRLPTAEA